MARSLNPSAAGIYHGEVWTDARLRDGRVPVESGTLEPPQASQQPGPHH